MNMVENTTYFASIAVRYSKLAFRAMVETVVVTRNLFALLVLAAVPGSAPQL